VHSFEPALIFVSVPSVPMSAPPTQLAEASSSSRAARVRERSPSDEYAHEQFAEFAASESDSDEEEYAFSGEDNDDVEEIIVQQAPEEQPQYVTIEPYGGTAAGVTPVVESLKQPPQPQPAQAKPKSSASSLPSLLPSINAVSSSLTAAGRAHFAQQISIFGRAAAPAPQPNPAQRAVEKPISVLPASPLSSSSRLSPSAVSAYASSNALCSSESLGFFALRVADPAETAETEPQALAAKGSAAGTEADAPATSLLIDGGRLRIWTGSLDLPSSALPSNPASALQSGAAAGALSGIFLRAALAGPSAVDGGAFLHLPLSASDPLGSPPPAADGSGAASLVTGDGLPGAAAELPSCYHPRRIGPYVLRVVGRGSSLPSAPESFTGFLDRAQQLGEQAEHAAEAQAASGQPPRSAADQPSVFDVPPQVTLYVAVEKLVTAQGAGSGGAAGRFASLPDTPPPSLPLLPIGCPCTFWLSTHGPSLLHSPSSGVESTSTLLFGLPAEREGAVASASSDHFELSLTAAPLHPGILEELALTDVRLQAEDQAAERKAKRKQQKRRNKKKQGRKATASSAEEGAAAAPSGDGGSLGDTRSRAAAAAGEQLLQVAIAAAPEGAPPGQLLQLSVTPAPAASAPTPASTAAAAPSLIDLLATLSARPSSSLPSSLLTDSSGRTVAAPGDSAAAAEAMAKLTQMAKAAVSHAASGGDKRGGSSRAPGDAAVPSPAAGQSNAVAAAASASAVPAPDVLLSALQRRVAWPFSVSLDAMRVSDECEGHASLDAACALDLLHNRPLPPAGKKASARAAAAPSSGTRPVLVGDHEVQLLRTVGLLCAWERPHNGSALSRPVLVSQQPLLSYHVQLRITRLDPDEANARGMDELLDL